MDKVVCIDNTGRDLTVGRTYIDTSTYYDLVLVIDDSGVQRFYHKRCFQKAFDYRLDSLLKD